MTAFSGHRDLAYALVAVAPVPGASGTSLTLVAGGGALMPAAPFYATLAPPNELPTHANSEVVLVTNVAGEVLTIDRAEGGTTAQVVEAGWQFFASVTSEWADEIEAAIDALETEATLTIEVTQAAHGFVVGDVLRRTATDYAKARADSDANAEAVGIVSDVIDANTFVLRSYGLVEGLAGLTSGVVYFLSDATAGLLTATEPTADGSITKPLLIALSATTGLFFNFRGMVLSDHLDGIVDVEGGGTNKVVTLSISGNPTGGTFTLTVSGFTTSALNFNASAADVQAALELLPTIGPGGVSASGGPMPNTPILIAHVRQWAASAPPWTITATSSLTGGTAPAISLATTTTPVPTIPLANGVQIGAAGLYLANSEAIKFGNVAGTTWIPVLSRDSSNRVVLRGGAGNTSFVVDSNGRGGLGVGNYDPNLVDTAAGSYSLYNATPTSGVTVLNLVGGPGQGSSPLLRFFAGLAGALGLRILPTGELQWGTASDVNLYRGGANQLKTDDDFVVLGALTLGTDLAVTEGGTGAGTAAGARTNLGLVIGTDVSSQANAEAKIAKSLVDAKGDLIVASANDTPARLPVGATDGHVLTVDAAQALGVKWAAQTGGGSAPADASYVVTAADAVLTNEKVLGTAVIMSGTLGARPAASIAGLLYFATDVGRGTLFRDTGAAWVQVGEPIGDYTFNGQAGLIVPTARGWTAAGSGFAANRVVLTRFVMPCDFSVTSLKFRTTTGGTGNVDVGIYDSTLANKLRSSGSTSGKKGANATQTVNLTSALALVAGTVYYAALESDTSDGNHTVANFGVSIHDQFFGTGIGVAETLFKDTTFPLPSSIATPTANSAIGAIMALV